jgi:hypothetical protein
MPNISHLGGSKLHILVILSISSGHVQRLYELTFLALCGLFPASFNFPKNIPINRIHQYDSSIQTRS